MTADGEDSPRKPVRRSKCTDGYPSKPDDVKHIRERDEDGNVRTHHIEWGDPEDGMWINVSDEDMENLYSRV